MNSLFLNFYENRELFTKLVIEHLKITFISVFIATLIGVFIGIIISEKRQIATTIISVVNVLYTIPSIALLGILISVTGIGNTTAIIALIVYGLLPIVRSTYTGLVNVDERITEASEALGSTKAEILYKIKLPLAFPVIFSAIRNMVTMTIALAGIASFVGAGGLGVAIYRGITTNNQLLLLAGSVLIAMIALIIDWIFGVFEKSIKNRTKIYKKKSIFIVGVVALATIIFSISGFNQSKETLKLASKPTTEGYILAEIAGQLIEDKSNLLVNITHGVGGGTSNLHPALQKGEFDMYPEYTGTAWQIVLKDDSEYSNDKFSELVKRYEEKYNITWKGMFGFNNTYSLGVHKDIAEKYNLKTYSSLAKVSKELIFGAEYDFFEREDGFNELSKAYNLEFEKNVDMDNGLKYNALLNKEIDVMTVFTTDGQLTNPNIVVLEDDKKFYPSYMAGLVVREDILKKYPELNNILAMLDNLIDEATMARLNNEVEIDKKTPKEIAKRFLESKNLLEAR